MRIFVGGDVEASLWMLLLGLWLDTFDLDRSGILFSDRFHLHLSFDRDEKKGNDDEDYPGHEEIHVWKSWEINLQDVPKRPGDTAKKNSNEDLEGVLQMKNAFCYTFLHGNVLFGVVDSDRISG